jgi:ppGpp synthetase/RelA/SpoT-type nucleotidyltranferase
VDIVKANAIRAQVTSRTKTADSFREKLERFSRRADKNMTDVDDVFSQVGDLAGVRIATYRQDDEKRVTEEIKKRFSWLKGLDVDIEVKDKLDLESKKYYRATHCQASLRDDDLIGDYENLRGASCEIQICSMMAHVWNEIEHDIGYKPEGGGPGSGEHRLLGALGHLTRSGDEVITALLDATFARLEAQKGDFNDVYDFVARLRKDLPDIDLAANAGQLFEALQALDLKSPERLKRYIGELKKSPRDAVQRIAAFNQFSEHRWGESFLLDDTTSDLLLVLLLEQFAKEIEHSFPAGRAMGRPARIRSISTRYLLFKDRH